MSEVSIFISFLAGVLSFVSPCILPVVPGYISLITWFTLRELQNERKDVAWIVFRNSIFFVLGFSLVFVLLGAAATYLG